LQHKIDTKKSIYRYPYLVIAIVEFWELLPVTEKLISVVLLKSKIARIFSYAIKSQGEYV